MEFVRTKKNQKAKDFADFILKECETRDFSIANMIALPHLFQIRLARQSCKMMNAPNLKFDF